MKTTKTIYLALLALLLSPMAVKAGLIVSASTVTSDQASTNVNNLINQSGLFSSYTSGVTDFDSYITSGPTHNGGSSAAIWGTNSGITTSELTFDFGSSILLESMALWNRGLSFQGIKSFNILACSDATCINSVVLGSYVAAGVNGSSSSGLTLPEVFAFTSTSTQFIQLDIFSGYNGSNLTAGEVAFEKTQAVPAPATLALLGLGLFCMVVRRGKVEESYVSTHQ
jgi:hypothetical protein